VATSGGRVTDVAVGWLFGAGGAEAGFETCGPAGFVAVGLTGGGAAVVVAGLAGGDTLGAPGDDLTSSFERSHVVAPMNVTNSAPANRTPIASGRDHLLDATGDELGSETSAGGAVGGSTAFPRALQKSSRFFRLLATKG